MSADFPSDPIGVLDPWAEDAPVLAGLASAPVQDRVTLGARAGARVQRADNHLAADPAPVGRRPGARDPGAVTPPRRLRPACRTAGARRSAEPVGTAFAGTFCSRRWRKSALKLTAAGRVGLPLPSAVGLDHASEFEPLDMLARLAAPTLRPGGPI